MCKYSDFVKAFLQTVFQLKVLFLKYQNIYSSFNYLLPFYIPNTPFYYHHLSSYFLFLLCFSLLFSYIHLICKMGRTGTVTDSLYLNKVCPQTLHHRTNTIMYYLQYVHPRVSQIIILSTHHVHDLGSSLQSKKISNNQELIQSDPISCPQNQKGNN